MILEETRFIDLVSKCLSGPGSSRGELKSLQNLGLRGTDFLPRHRIGISSIPYFLVVH